jgi:nucleoid-associated protein YgaU
MTRETKIGLLVGLGFIVVFAVVLSHTGTPQTPGDGLTLVQIPDEPVETLTPDPFAPAPIERPTPFEEEVVVTQNPPTPLMRELPSPEELIPPPVTIDTFADSETLPAPDYTETENHTALIHPPHVAPALDDPKPAEREHEPTVTPTPGPDRPAPRLEPDQPPTKMYVVQKGETLGGIAEKHYGTSKPKVVEYLVSKNKGTIKSKDVVIVGQEIVIPELPSDMFEPAPGFQASNLNRSERLVLDERTSTPLLNGRRAPRSDQTEYTLQTTSSQSSGYTVQPGDTLVKIAREQLGSASDWKTIQKLNGNLDPKKLRPGMKIRIPARQPVSRAGDPKRVEA